MTFSHVLYAKFIKNKNVVILAVPGMKSFRSATTLCIPDPTFNDVTRHRLMLSQGTPVQRELLTGLFVISLFTTLYEIQ